MSIRPNPAMQNQFAIIAARRRSIPLAVPFVFAIAGITTPSLEAQTAPSAERMRSLATACARGATVSCRLLGDIYEAGEAVALRSVSRATSELTSAGADNPSNHRADDCAKGNKHCIPELLISLTNVGRTALVA